MRFRSDYIIEIANCKQCPDIHGGQRIFKQAQKEQDAAYIKIFVGVHLLVCEVMPIPAIYGCKR
jgi:hypothetical protein